MKEMGEKNLAICPKCFCAMERNPTGLGIRYKCPDCFGTFLFIEEVGP